MREMTSEREPLRDESPLHLYDLEDQRDTKVLDLEAQKKLIQLSQQMLVKFYTLMRTLTFHYNDNEAVQAALEQLNSAITELFEYEYEIHIEFTGTDFLVNERWSRLNRQYQELCNNLGREWKRREIGGMWITALPTKRQLLQFVELLLKVDPDQMSNPFALIQTQLWRRGFHWVTLEKYVEFEDWEKDKLTPRQAIKQVYFQALEVMKQFQAQIQGERPLKLKMAKRVIQSLIRVMETPHYANTLPLLLALTQIKGAVEYQLTHPINTAILAVGWGFSMQMDRLFLRDLGISALLADSGLIQRLSYLEEPNPKLLPPEEYERHPVDAIPHLLHTTLIDSTILRSVNVSFSHHLGWKGGGFPTFGRGINSLSAQMIAIVQMYDELTSPDSPREHTYSPPEALVELATVPSHHFVPNLVKLFISWIGPFPIGTLVQLNDGSLGYVWLKSQNPAVTHKPIVKILKSNYFPPGTIINLAENNPPLEISNVLRNDLGEAQQLMLNELIR